jgi:RimJ/RimL family protein N-acetyltransferase
VPTLIPAVIETRRLHLRSWRAEDATVLHPILVENHTHLAPWIPAHVADPATLPELEKRLAGFANDFAAGGSWRFAFFARDSDVLLGEISLFARNATARVRLAEADRAEIGYWLRADQTGAGLVTEGARAVVNAAAAVKQFSHIEIRCDARNTASGAVAARLGFSLATPIAEAGVAADSPEYLQVWRS